MTTLEPNGRTRAKPEPLAWGVREALDRVHEEWVAHPDKRQISPLKEHGEMAHKTGWFPSGWRGDGPDMKPLEPEVVAYFERDNH